MLIYYLAQEKGLSSKKAKDFLKTVKTLLLCAGLLLPCFTVGPFLSREAVAPSSSRFGLGLGSPHLV